MSSADLSFGKLGRQTLIYGLGFVLGRAASFVMLPIYTRFLTPADYGVLQLVQMTVEVAAILLAAGINNGVLRFYFKAPDDAQRQRVVATAFLLLEAFNALTAAVLVGAAPRIADSVLGDPSLARLVHIAAASILFEACSIIPLLLAQAKQRAVFYTMVSAARLALQLGLNVLFLVILDYGVEGVLWSTLLTNVCMGAVLAFWMIRQVGLRTDGRTVRGLLRFGLPYRVTQMGTFVLTFGDRYFLKVFHDLTVIGLYSLAYPFGVLLMYLATLPFMQAWNPQRFELAHRPRAERDAMYNQGLLYLSLLLVSVATGIALFVTPVLQIMSDEAFHSAARLVPVILAAYVMQSWTDVAELGIQVSERTEYATYATWISVIAILGLYVLLIPPLGGLGAAIATLASFTLRFVCFLAWSQRFWPVSYRWRPSLLLLAYGTATVAGGLAWTPDGWLACVAWSALLFAAYALLAIFGGALDRDERNRLWDLARRHAGGLRASWIA